MADLSPARIDREALERIIHRAAELQAAERPIGEGLTQDDVLALGKEVGIPTRFLQQALLEERARGATLAPGGVWDRIAGPPQASAQRVIRGTTDEIERALLRWMDQHELFRVQRHQPGRIVWEPLGGIPAAIRRSTAALGSGRKPYMLARAEVVSATIVPLEDGFALVALVASARRTRANYATSSAVLTTAGIGTTALLVTLGAFFPVALLPIPAAVGISYGVLRQYPPKVERLRVGLERVLDHLEQQTGPQSGQPPRAIPEQTSSIFDLLADEVRRALKS